MSQSIITKKDLLEFKKELLQEIEDLFKNFKKEEKVWLRTAEVKKLLNISSGTLQNLRINGTIVYSKIGGTLFYNYNDIEKLMKDFKIKGCDYGTD